MRAQFNTRRSLIRITFDQPCTNKTGTQHRHAERAALHFAAQCLRQCNDRCFAGAIDAILGRTKNAPMDEVSMR